MSDVSRTRWSGALRPGLYPHWVLSIRLFFSKYHISLLFSIFSSILLRHEIRAIGR